MRKIALYCGFFSLLTVLIGVFPLWGQEFARHGVQVLDETVVTATGIEVPLKETSTSTSIINKKQMEARQEPRVENFLRDICAWGPRSVLAEKNLRAELKWENGG